MWLLVGSVLALLTFTPAAHFILFTIVPGCQLRYGWDTNRADGFISPIQWNSQEDALWRLPGTPFYLSHEALLFNFFTEVKELACQFKSSVMRGAAVIGNQHMWKAFSRDLIEGVCSPDIILISDSLEKIKWSQVISAIKVKWKDSPELFWSALDQLGDKAAFIFHHQPQSCAEQPFTCLFTCGGSIHSQPLDIGLDLKMFLKIWNDKPYWLEDDKEEEMYRLSVFKSYILLTPVVRQRVCGEDGVYCYICNLYWNKINSLPGITIMKDHMHPSFGLLSKSSLSPMSVTSIGAVMISAEDLANIFSTSPKYHQLEEHHQSHTNFTTYGVNILWFGMAQDMFHGIIGAVVGHRNAYEHQQVLHCDVSDGNSMLLVWNISAECAIPPHPKKAPEGWTSMRDGMTSDWGSAADCTDLAGEEHLPYLTGDTTL
ncbi:hypothetical protein BD769DRAFT_1384212 [Suillus cothurnatus]|nr:hypothetical protein BD769DRAFT_1384212 [Suillus cothurnatus]